jgi:glutathione peroxidase
MRPKFISTVGLSLAFLSFNCFSSAERPEGAQSRTSIHEYSVAALDGSTIQFSDFKGKKILIVNVASKCGFTPQYEGLEELYQTHGGNLVIVGFPSNSFRQEFESNEEIAAFCQKNYGVTFPLTERVSVRGSDQHPVFEWLTDESLNGWNTTAPQWNFYKYLINEEGELTHVFPSNTEPLSEEIVTLL